MACRILLLVVNCLASFVVVNSFLTTTNNFGSIRQIVRQQILALDAKKTRGGGGRAPGNADKVESSDEWQPLPCEPDEARLTIIQITDTYTLEHLASVKTLQADIRAKSTGSKVVSMMTGDFLAPYLLSSVDRGQGMMNALGKIPIDYITWGNHE